jgi:outer membrane immunogenic protein
MKLGRNSLLALAIAASMATGMATGVPLAAADGPPGGGPGVKGEGWPNTPWRSWQGLYGGAHAGNSDAWGDEGFLGGVQLGRNWQTGMVVFGIEGDVSLVASDSIDWVATLRGRVGYLLSPNLLLYGTAGVGLVDVGQEGTETDFVYGLGIEGKLTEATTVRLEYLGFNDTEVDIVRLGVNWKLNW